MKLTPQTYEHYLMKTYAAWLGKIIGVRLGAPVENWSHEQIVSTYGDREGYLVDYDIFAADDDINGPLFFVRALLDKTEITAEDIGNAFLNYIPEYHGFFWWGGVGVSTEHTAYENLKNGIRAPASGSALTNGLTMAEQIGGQIFSDCWGYVSGYDTARAAELAEMASSVTHDGNGIQGGIFVAAAISSAYTETDIYTVLDRALECLDPDMEYARVCRDIIRFYHENPDDQNACFEYIRNTYGYDRYPGVCHIIPNTAIMIMAMCYGRGDFTKTLTMLNRCGWDTDCTCGNVGSIMGALVGLQGISSSWILPVNDMINASSCIGCLNIASVSDTAKMFADIAMKLAGYEPPEILCFHLPYGTKGFRGAVCTVEDDALRVQGSDVYRYTYYLADQIYDARYDPEFSPTVMPGDTLFFEVSSPESQKIRIYVRDCEGNEYEGMPEDIKERTVLSFRIPSKINMTVNLCGIRSESSFVIHDFRCEHHPDAEYSFADYPADEYGPRYEGDCMHNIRGFVKHSGSWNIENGALTCRGSGMISTGVLGSRYEEIVWEFMPDKCGTVSLIFNMTGFQHYNAVILKENFIEVVRVNVNFQTVNKFENDFRLNSKTSLKVKYINDKIHLFTEGRDLECDIRDSLHDLVGFAVTDGEANNYGLKLISSFKYNSGGEIK